MKLAAVITETRPSAGLKIAIESVEKYLPDHDKYAYGSEQTKPFFTGYDFRIERLSHLRMYNLFMTSFNFWHRLRDYDKVLIFQSDSEVLRHGIEDFYEWDYVGAPWIFQEHGGNGGFSLRNPSIMLEVIHQGNYTHAQYEDVWFCNEMHNKGIGKLAPYEVCKKFSCEAIFSMGTFGYHAIHNYFTQEQITKVINQYEK